MKEQEAGGAAVCAVCIGVCVCVCVGGVEKIFFFLPCEVFPVLSVKEKRPGEVTGE